MKRRTFYFSTRDLITMAALAALGGVSSTYVNMIGNFFQASLGVAGTTQWAAGLHVLWLVLAFGMIGKTGTGLVTGVLKGVVELLSGNTHGIIILLVDLVAGLLIEVVFLFFKNKRNLGAFLLAGGISSASNVYVFQVFAFLPRDVLILQTMFLVSFVAFISGMVFAGGIGKVLIESLIRAGLIPAQLPAVKIQKRILAISGLITLVAIVILGTQIFHSMVGANSIKIDGAVNNPFNYPNRSLPFQETQAQGTLKNVSGNYTGVRLSDLIAYAQPNPDAKLVLISANDGYAFLIDMQEVKTNQQLLLSTALVGSNPVFNITGAVSSKAWVRGVAKITVILGVCLPIKGNLSQPGEFCPQDWQTKMDSTNLNLSIGDKKVQGVKLSQLLQSMTPEKTDILVVLITEAKQFELKYQDVMQQDIRVFTVIDGPLITFTVAKMSGEIIAENVTKINVQ